MLRASRAFPGTHGNFLVQEGERFRDLAACGGCPVHCLSELCDISVATFRQKIERYAEGGGDDGLTKAAMRAACGLPAEDVALYIPDGAGHGVVSRPGTGVVETGRRGRCLVGCWATKSGLSGAMYLS